MKHLVVMLAAFAAITLHAVSLSAFAESAPAKPDRRRLVAVIATSLGNITVELFNDKAPLSVDNFLSYARTGFYNETIFHRVIPSFMIQGGGFTADMKQKATRPPIKNEAANGLSNRRGTLAMARTRVVDSATSQFFINLQDNTFLDHMVRDFGYAVFGRVINGMDVVDRIAQAPTGTRGGMRDIPLDPVFIHSVNITESTEKE